MQSLLHSDVQLNKPLENIEFLILGVFYNTTKVKSCHHKIQWASLPYCFDFQNSQHRTLPVTTQHCLPSRYGLHFSRAPTAAEHSFSVVLQFLSAMVRAQLAKAIVLVLDPCFCINIAPSPTLLTSARPLNVSWS